LISDIAPPSLLVFSVHPHEDIPKDYYITVISEKKQKIWILWALQRNETGNLQPSPPGNFSHKKGGEETVILSSLPFVMTSL
jgi:hypothetical protein